MKKGLSPILSVLLLVFLVLTIAISIIAWMRTASRQTREGLEETTGGGDVNFYISNIERSGSTVNITITNNGMFSIPVEEINGYYDGRLSNLELIEGDDPIPPGESAKFRMTIS